MITVDNIQICGWMPAIRGMRNPKNSWEKSDTMFDVSLHASEGQSSIVNENGVPDIGENDLKLMKMLAKGGPVHGKYKRMITVYMDITAPLYWWKEFDTYKVGTVADSCSTMHKIHSKKLTLEDFSTEHLDEASLSVLQSLIDVMNKNRFKFVKEKNKDNWWQMIQLLPTSFNQTRTVLLNYEVLTNMYYSRKTHKLDEWRDFCEMIKSLPYSELILNQELDVESPEG